MSGINAESTTVAVGNPAHPIREITDADASALQYYAQ